MNAKYPGGTLEVLRARRIEVDHRVTIGSEGQTRAERQKAGERHGTLEVLRVRKIEGDHRVTIGCEEQTRAERQKAGERHGTPQCSREGDQE